MLTLLSLQGSSAQQPGSVQGRVVIDTPSTAKRPTSAYPNRTVTAVTLAPPSEVRNVVIFLKDAPAHDVTPTRVGIRQRNETFTPRVVAVPVGSEVDFPNDDPYYHNVFSLSRSRAFNLGRYPKGQTRVVRFGKPGIVKVFCDIHSHMSATVVVFNHPWYAVPDDEGRFEIAEPPAGQPAARRLARAVGQHHAVRCASRPAEAASVEFTLPVPAP